VYKNQFNGFSLNVRPETETTTGKSLEDIDNYSFNRAPIARIKSKN
jgi:hypothetical protein